MPYILNSNDLEKELDDLQWIIFDPDTIEIDPDDPLSQTNADEEASTSKDRPTTNDKFSDLPYFILFCTQFLV